MVYHLMEGAARQGDHDGVILLDALRRDVCQHPHQDGHATGFGQLQKKHPHALVGINVHGNGGLGPDDQLRTIGHSAAGKCLVGLHHLSRLTYAPVVQRGVIALNGGHAKSLCVGRLSVEREAHKAEGHVPSKKADGEQQGGKPHATRASGGVRSRLSHPRLQEAGKIAVGGNNEERQGIRPKQNGGLKHGQQMGLTQCKAAPRHARPATVCPPPLKDHPQASQQERMQEATARYPPTAQDQRHDREQERGAHGLKGRKTHPRYSHHNG